MEPVREAARRLAARGAIEITQRGAVVDPLSFRGPIRLRLCATPTPSAAAAAAALPQAGPASGSC